jgi:hypothetical protein
VPLKEDMSLFLYNKSNAMIFFLICVDYIIVTSSSDQAISMMLHGMQASLALTDFGDLHFFLGIDVKHI